MDGGASSSSGHPYVRRSSNKRTFSDMSASHRDSSTPLRDTHYDSEHSSRRRRLRTDLPRIPVHYPGDGLDFRRPVMSTSARPRRPETENRSSARHRAAVIDLTDERETHESSQSSEAPARQFAMPRGYSRAQRLPRFGRDVIEVESSGEDEDEEQERDLSNLPGANFLALPHRRARPHLSGLRRPARPPSPPTDMDDVEFLEERPRPQPRSSRSRVASQQPSPAPTRSRVLRERTVTPYPTAMANETIDLTEENDDDIVHLNTRQRPAANHAANPPRNLPPTMGVGYIAGMLQNGGRLMQRLQGAMGLNGELMAQQQAWDHFNNNHVHIHDHRHGAARVDYNALAERAALGAAARHAAGRRPSTQARPVRPPPGGQAFRIAQEMAGLMAYDTPAFDMGYAGGNAPPAPRYEAPPAPEKGFTRGPEEDEVVVCPNCGDELAVGEGEVKQEIWVVKGCGHAYCGDCAHNRTRAVGKKGKGKGKGKEPVYQDQSLPMPFKQCVVEGCNKSTGGKTNMIMAYLGC